MTEEKHLNVVDISHQREQEEAKDLKEFLESLNGLLSNLRKAAEEKRLTDLIIQWDELTPKESEDEEDTTTYIMHFNEENDITRTIGFTQRLITRLSLWAEGLIR